MKKESKTIVKINDLVKGNLYYFDSKTSACGYFDSVETLENGSFTVFFKPKEVGNYALLENKIPFSFYKEETELEFFYEY